MDDKLLVAVIAGSSALLGSLIPTLVGFFNNRCQRAFELKKELIARQRTAYSQMLLNLQATMNNGNEGFQKLQQSILEVAVYGDKETAAAVHKYYLALVHRGAELKKEEHAQFQTGILNAMRANLDLKPLDSFELVRFTPDDIQANPQQGK